MICDENERGPVCDDGGGAVLNSDLTAAAFLSADGVFDLVRPNVMSLIDCSFFFSSLRAEGAAPSQHSRNRQGDRKSGTNETIET